MQEQSRKKASKHLLIFYILIAVILLFITVWVAILLKTPASKPEEKDEDQITDTEKSINMRERISEPIADNDYGFAFNTVGNTVGYFHLSWEAKNLSDKTIKYCSYKVLVYNRVGDIIYSKTYTLTGPFGPGDILGVVDDVITSGDFISSVELDNFYKIEISEITLEYMDGSKEHGRYGFGTENTYKIG